MHLLLVYIDILIRLLPHTELARFLRTLLCQTATLGWSLFCFKKCKILMKILFYKYIILRVHKQSTYLKYYGPKHNNTAKFKT